MNILVLFSYGSLRTLDDVAGFFDDIYHGHATDEDIAAAEERYQSMGMPDPLGAHTHRIGRALMKRLIQETGEEWHMFIGNHHAQPSIESVAETCAEMRPKRVATFGLTPFDSVTGNKAYEKKFRKHFLALNDTAELVHISPYCDHEPFVKVLSDRAETARNWLPADVRNEAEIVFTVHSLPGLPEVHKKMIGQYEELARKVATSVQVKDYHIAYRSGNPGQRWLEPDVLDVVSDLAEQDTHAIVFVEALSVIENLEVLEEVTGDAIQKARNLGIQAVQSEYLNDSVDFIEALEEHILNSLI